MLGLPSSVKYIDRSKRPKRIFIKQKDGTLEDIFQIYFVHSDQQSTSQNPLCWYQDKRSNVYAGT